MIRVVSRKNEVLISAALILVLLVILTWFSASDQCGGLDSDTKDIEKKCMNEHLRLNCSSSNRKGAANWEYCEEINSCLKNPLDYKERQEQIKWDELMDDLKMILGYGKTNFWWLCICGLLTATVQYFKIK